VQKDNYTPELILASASPRRQELLASVGLEFTVLASHIDESTLLSEPSEIVTTLALAKAKEVACRLSTPAPAKRRLILAADTIVVLGDLVLGKPQSPAQAYEMLCLLSGREHKVYTGVALVEMPGDHCRTIYRASSIFFRELARSEMEYYASSSEPLDKAGAYALQGTAAAFVERVEGCYTNVIGLPLSATVQLLRESGLTVMGAGRPCLE
jgi:septum formation protein